MKYFVNFVLVNIKEWKYHIFKGQDSQRQVSWRQPELGQMQTSQYKHTVTLTFTVKYRPDHVQWLNLALNEQLIAMKKSGQRSVQAPMAHQTAVVMVTHFANLCTKVSFYRWAKCQCRAGSKLQRIVKTAQLLSVRALKLTFIVKMAQGFTPDI